MMLVKGNYHYCKKEIFLCWMNLVKKDLYFKSKFRKLLSTPFKGVKKTLFC